VLGVEGSARETSGVEYEWFDGHFCVTCVLVGEVVSTTTLLLGKFWECQERGVVRWEMAKCQPQSNSTPIISSGVMGTSFWWSILSQAICGPLHPRLTVGGNWNSQVLQCHYVPVMFQHQLTTCRKQESKAFIKRPNLSFVGMYVCTLTQVCSELIWTNIPTIYNTNLTNKKSVASSPPVPLPVF
jgi:hypothetical protein